MRTRRLSQLLTRARRLNPGDALKLSPRETLIVQAITQTWCVDILDQLSVDSLLNEPSSGDPERDEFKDVVRKLDNADYLPTLDTNLGYAQERR